MGQHLEHRPDGSYALFIDGDLQFDTRDEALYHEMLALPALCMARPLLPGEGLRVLICGGGDGLALRECLRFPNVAHVDLVDYDPEIVEMGRVAFAEQNAFVFHDPRASVHIEDAWEFLQRGELYDVILLDFTVPRKPDDVRIFTQEWYERVKSSLAPDGILAINGVSPQLTPEAFWCLHKTVRATGLSVLPYRCCIPSFRDQGYGAWAFLVAARRPLTVSMLKKLNCPVETQLADLKKLDRGAHFTREERQIEARVPVHTLSNPCYLPLLLNAGLQGEATSTALSETEPYSLEPLFKAIPVLHPYHTREMIETLASQVAGSVRALDLTRLIDALLARASRLTDSVISELRRLKDFLQERLLPFEIFRRWAHRLFALLVVFMTMANVIAPDTAFAKGAAGIGHSSMSRGYSSSYRSSSGSFSGSRGTGSSFGSGRQTASGSFGRASIPRTSSIRSTGFRSSSVFGRTSSKPNGVYGGSVDIYGNVYPVRVYSYHSYSDYGSGYGYDPYSNGSGNNNARPANLPAPKQQQAAFVADEDMLVMDNGDVIITLSDSAYLLVNEGKVALFHQKRPDPLFAMMPDPELFQAIREQLEDQKLMAEGEIRLREDWLEWAGWTSALFPTVKADKAEVANLRELLKRLETALQRLGTPKPDAAPKVLPPGAVELFAGAFLLPDRTVQLRRPDGGWQMTNGKTVWAAENRAKTSPAPPELQDALKSILTKLEKELNADLQADDTYLNELYTDMGSLQKDLAEYTQLGSQWGMSESVDYGTDEIPCSEAIDRTQKDITDTQKEWQETQQDRTKTAADLTTIHQAWLGEPAYQAPALSPTLMTLPSINAHTLAQRNKFLCWGHSAVPCFALKSQ